MFNLIKTILIKRKNLFGKNGIKLNFGVVLF